ncbi:HNH endonuclease signature motif containing protein [Cellulosimicrobium sp. Marseille-Q4280]|uniref:HNH endonuclease n=1 Tax=Cellulosimicrobium sp. Marseille-Q4280 TaxID=2937992 RepID=UPI00203C9341|nr:HNH endonuclease signature motif containing protein [Cellulosimicrobium sp. Marseille-Q4280]
MRFVGVGVGLGLALVGVIAAGGGLQDPVGPVGALRQWMVAVAALIALGALAQRLGGGTGRWTGEKDPQRMYSVEQRRVIHARAGGQCEYTGWGWQRCRSASEHADHLHPHAKGGATSLLNGVASCAHHNTSKGAKLLPKSKIRSLERRRRRYFPPGAEVRVGELYDPATTRVGEMGLASAAQAPAEFVLPAGWGDEPESALPQTTAPPVPLSTPGVQRAANGAAVPSRPRDVPLW